MVVTVRGSQSVGVAVSGDVRCVGSHCVGVIAFADCIVQSEENRCYVVFY